MKTKNTYLIAAFLGTALFACHKPEHPGFEKSASGLFYKELIKSKDTARAHVGDRLTVALVIKTEKDCTLIDTRKQGPIQIPMRKPVYNGDVFDAMASMKSGDSTQFLLKAKDYFDKLEHKALPPYIDSASFLYFTVKINKIEPKALVDIEMQKRKEEQQKMMEEQKKLGEVAKAEEPALLSKYIADNKIKAKPTASGLYYIETTKGTGANAKAGQIVSVKYTGKFLSGEVFDASEKHGGQPIDFPVGEHRVIAGWDEALLLMKKGGKATFVIPSSIGYGDGGGQFKPYSTLVFDVELVDIKDAPAHPAK
jgi:FKBP-type peptidyl-prolyl cis-trans isomerase FkpA